MRKYTERLSENGLAIFLFHGVIERSPCTVRNYTKKHLEKDHFYRLMQELKTKGEAVSMDDVVACATNGIALPSYAFAITFDDGFENNYSIAAPILKDLGLPATFYVTTDFVDRNTMSWIDRIEYCFEKTPAGVLRFPWSDDVQRFSTPRERIQLLDQIRSHVKRDASIDQESFVHDIFSQCNVVEITSSDDPLDRKMNWQQVRTLSEEKLFTIGGHSHRHAILSFLKSIELEREVRESITLLKERAGIKPIYYSYPEGLAHCYSDEVIATLKRYGIVCCPTAEDGVNPPHTDLFHLKRIFVV